MMTDASRADDEPLVLNVRKSGKQLGMSAKTIRRHIKHGSLKPVWLGAMLGVHVNELRRAAEEGLPRLPPLPNYKKLKARAKEKHKAAPQRATKRGGRPEQRAVSAP
jgi:hypothetical protein